MRSMSGQKILIDKEFKSCASKLQLNFQKILSSIDELASYLSSENKTKGVFQSIIKAFLPNQVMEEEVMKFLYEPIQIFERTLKVFELSYISRIYELYEKTNQFNITYLLNKDRDKEKDNIEPTKS